MLLSLESLTFTPAIVFAQVVYASLTIWSALIGIPVLRKTPNKCACVSHKIAGLAVDRSYKCHRVWSMTF